MRFELVKPPIEDLASTAGLVGDVRNHPPVVRDRYGSPDISLQCLARRQCDRQPRCGHRIGTGWDMPHEPSGGQTCHNRAAHACDQPSPVCNEASSWKLAGWRGCWADYLLYRLDFHHRCDETVSLARDGLDKTGVFGRVAQRLANLLDRRVQAGIELDERVNGPKASPSIPHGSPLRRGAR